MEPVNEAEGENAMHTEQAAAPYVTYDAKVRVKMVGSWIRGNTESYGSYNAVRAATQGCWWAMSWVWARSW